MYIYEVTLIVVRDPFVCPMFILGNNVRNGENLNRS